MPFWPKNWLIERLMAPILRPLTRLVVGLVAIPVLRLIRSRIRPLQDWDDELEKDIEQWFRASLLLLFATKNMEMELASWLDMKFQLDINHWYVAAGRLLLAIGVVESMPDQHLFAIVHPGPPPLKWERQRGIIGNIRDQAWPVIRGLLCKHLARSSPVFAIMAAIFADTPGWVCYWLAITQYLIIGLVTSQDKARDVLSAFDREMAQRRRDLVDEFRIDESAGDDSGLSKSKKKVEGPDDSRTSVESKPVAPSSCTDPT